MNDEVRQALVKLLASFGTSLITEPRRLRNLLSDECPGSKREISVLVKAAEENLVAQLQSSASAPWETVSGRLVSRLMHDAAIAEDAACWAVESWALALGRVIPVTAIPGTKVNPVPQPSGPQPGGKAGKPTLPLNPGTTATGPTVQPPTQPQKPPIAPRSWWKAFVPVAIFGTFIGIRSCSGGPGDPKKASLTPKPLVGPSIKFDFTPKPPPAPAITYQWGFTVGRVLGDDIWLTNTSAVTISNVEFTVTIVTNGRTWDPRVYKEPGIWPGQKKIWPNVLPAGGQYDPSKGSLRCDQMKGP